MQPLKTIDDYVFRGINIINQAWNYTTGGTKTDLCYLLLGISVAANLARSLPKGNNGWAAFNLFVSGTIAYNAKIIEEKEKIVSKGLLDIEAERLKKLYKFLGYTIASLTSISLLVDRTENYKDQTLHYLDNATFALGLLMINADPLPPQKDCISRGIDKLTKMIKKYKPALV
ncbi:MAG: hypothetical protein Q7R96_05455 [Nanoarchaeota archaeon]|nr:hypothetical protein [Nanoarchaeota archaeon]